MRVGTVKKHSQLDWKYSIGYSRKKPKRVLRIHFLKNAPLEFLDLSFCP